MLSRMGLVMLAGKGLLGTRTGRALVGRLGRRLARTALAGTGRAARGTGGPAATAEGSGGADSLTWRGPCCQRRMGRQPGPCLCRRAMRPPYQRVRTRPPA